MHLKEKQFPCPHCGKRFGKKHYLEEHVAGVHEGVRYACDQCDYSASIKSNLLMHVKMIHLKELKIRLLRYLLHLKKVLVSDY